MTKTRINSGICEYGKLTPGITGVMPAKKYFLIKIKIFKRTYFEHVLEAECKKMNSHKC